MHNLKDINFICSCKLSVVEDFVETSVSSGSLSDFNVISGYYRDVNWLNLLGFIDSDKCSSLHNSLRSLIRYPEGGSK